jgi:hypothetical protein
LGELTTFLGQLPYILDYIISAQLSSRCPLFELIFDILLEKDQQKIPQGIILLFLKHH